MSAESELLKAAEALVKRWENSPWDVAPAEDKLRFIALRDAVKNAKPVPREWVITRFQDGSTPRLRTIIPGDSVVIADVLPDHIREMVRVREVLA